MKTSLYTGGKLQRFDGVVVAGAFGGKADQVALKGYFRTGTAPTAIAQNIQEVSQNAKVAATVTAGFRAHIQGNRFFLFTEAVQNDLLRAHIRFDLTFRTKDLQLT